MDPKIVIGFIFSHYVVIFGTTLALFFTVSMILLIRSIGQNSEENLAIDVTAIEGAMKRVLATQPISIAAGTKVVAPAAAPGAPADGSADAPVVEEGGAGSEDLQAAVAERDAKIQALNQEMDELKATMTHSAEAADTSGFTSEIANLNGKIEELQARLAEYEIIEDDIADLSMFKDENRKLKEEIELLKSQAASASASASAAKADEPQASLTPSLDAGIKFEKKDKFELDLNDDAIRAFAAANGAPVESPAPAPETVAPESLGSQSEIDALLKAHSSGAAAAPEPVPAAVDPQAEIDALMKAQAASSAPAPAPAPEAPAATPTAAPVDPQAEIDALMKAHSAQNAAPAVEEPAPVASPVVHSAPSAFDDLFGADSAVQVHEEPKAPALANENENEDPLAGTPDPDKMLSEVETLAGNDHDGLDALEESLDTDRLLAEVDSLSKGKESA